MQGDIEFAGGLHIDGRVTQRTCHRGAAASLRSARRCGRGVGRGAAGGAQGRVNGDIFGRERVVLGGKARVRGNVHYGVIEMALGAEIIGKLVPRSDQPAASKAD